MKNWIKVFFSYSNQNFYYFVGSNLLKKHSPWEQASWRFNQRGLIFFIKNATRLKITTKLFMTSTKTTIRCVVIVIPFYCHQKIPKKGEKLLQKSFRFPFSACSQVFKTNFLPNAKSNFWAENKSKASAIAQSHYSFILIKSKSM